MGDYINKVLNVCEKVLLIKKKKEERERERERERESRRFIVAIFVANACEKRWYNLYFLEEGWLYRWEEYKPMPLFRQGG